MISNSQNSPAVPTFLGNSLGRDDAPGRANTDKKWDIHFLRLCFMAAQSLSKDPATKVGSAIVTPDRRNLSLGYNGFPPGMEETPERWERPEKYDRVVHAETNALLNAPFDTKGCTIYITIPPCDRCFSQIVTAGIVRVVTYATTRPMTGRLDIIAELRNMVDYTEYDGDPVIDGLPALFSSTVFPGPGEEVPAVFS
jgi:dCMP deaminase